MIQTNKKASGVLQAGDKISNRGDSPATKSTKPAEKVVEPIVDNEDKGQEEKDTNTPGEPREKDSENQVIDLCGDDAGTTGKKDGDSDTAVVKHGSKDTFAIFGNKIKGR